MSDAGSNLSANTKIIQRYISGVCDLQIQHLLQESLTSLCVQTQSVDNTRRQRAQAQLGQLKAFVTQWATRFDELISFLRAFKRYPEAYPTGSPIDTETSSVMLKNLVRQLLHYIKNNIIDETHGFDMWFEAVAMQQMHENGETQRLYVSHEDLSSLFEKLSENGHKKQVKIITDRLNAHTEDLDRISEGLSRHHPTNFTTGAREASLIHSVIANTRDMVHIFTFTCVYDTLDGLCKNNKELLQDTTKPYIETNLHAFNVIINDYAADWLECEIMLIRVTQFNEYCDAIQRTTWYTKPHRNTSDKKELSMSDIRAKVIRTARSDTLNIAGLYRIVASVITCFSNPSPDINAKAKSIEQAWNAMKNNFKPYADTFLKRPFSPFSSPAAKLNRYLDTASSFMHMIKAEHSHHKLEDPLAHLFASQPPDPHGVFSLPRQPPPPIPLRPTRVHPREPSTEPPHLPAYHTTHLSSASACATQSRLAPHEVSRLQGKPPPPLPTRPMRGTAPLEREDLDEPPPLPEFNPTKMSQRGLVRFGSHNVPPFGHTQTASTSIPASNTQALKELFEQPNNQTARVSERRR